MCLGPCLFPRCPPGPSIRLSNRKASILGRLGYRNLHSHYPFYVMSGETFGVTLLVFRPGTQRPRTVDVYGKLFVKDRTLIRG